MPPQRTGSAISGDTAVIGAYGNDDGGNYSGSAYVFTHTAGVWSQQAKLTASDPAAGDGFGISVAISGDTAVIGADGDDDGGNYSGSAYVFTHTAGVWSQQAKLTASDAATYDRFGASVAVNNDTALIGAFEDDDGGYESGSAYVFNRSGGVWSQQTKLTASDPAAGDGFGSAVALSGDTAIIGADGDNDGGYDSGSAYIFTRTAGVWSQQAKLTASDPAAENWFGTSVDISGDTALIGANQFVDECYCNSGKAYIFTRTAGVWSQQAKLTANDSGAGDMFGSSVALSGDTALIGAKWDHDAGERAGSAYVFMPTIDISLTTTLSGTGSGNVVSHPNGIDCGVVCMGIFITNTVVTLTATAETGSAFTGWSGDIVTSTNPITVMMDSNKDIMATFALNEYTLALSAEPAEGGAVEGGGEFTYGQVVTVTATAAAGYTFEHWTEEGDIVSTEAHYNFTTTAERTLVAHFVAIPPATFNLYLPVIRR